MAISNIDSNNSSQFVFVHFNVKIDNKTCMLIDNSINELVDDLKVQSIKYFDEIIVHDWNAVMFSREFDGNSQILHYMVIDAPNMISDKENLNRKMEIFVDGIVKLFISKYITRV